jgi:hypothetical protein
MVKEKLTDLIEAIRMDRASILALAQEVAASVDLQDGKQGPNVVPLNPRR